MDSSEECLEQLTEDLTAPLCNDPAIVQRVHDTLDTVIMRAMLSDSYVTPDFIRTRRQAPVRHEL